MSAGLYSVWPSSDVPLTTGSGDSAPEGLFASSAMASSGQPLKNKYIANIIIILELTTTTFSLSYFGNNTAAPALPLFRFITFLSFERQSLPKKLLLQLVLFYPPTRQPVINLLNDQKRVSFNLLFFRSQAVCASHKTSSVMSTLNHCQTVEMCSSRTRAAK